MKIAILFRGPIRPNPQSVIARYNDMMNQFATVRTGDGSPITIHTYLATWRKWKEFNASDLLALNLFDNVLMQEEPTDDRRNQITSVKKLPNGADIVPVFNMYYQSKTALDIIINSNNYDYIVHSRTDLCMIMNEFMPEWFDVNNYVAPHIHQDPWMCDQFGVAPAQMMHAAWDYGDIQNLGKLIEEADIPERVLENMMVRKGIPMKKGRYAAWQLDPTRNN